ncbi:MetQ/NlpA family ABC transporter substrate-binding protein [Mitsuokella sp. oral taxon 131]|uniref:MetQ/NlpA family ABC transporter substrate-binding protein n=1 Tax=Mitsuokella sp. oral taxon 131 TaxID=1321780 RepID=UPI0003AE3EA7|nr:MetQ/NlpA family ABC transporter substrate-binding protein [Mitsuokella sp. oral taxon 131]ERL04298.1 lipoprotein, YaeC family [Mitsuokella sp. oral taxon 131 str. W9106]
MKKILALITTLSIAVLALAGCGANNGASSSSGTNAVAQSSSGMKTLKVGATAVPHAEILEKVKPILEKQGIKLDIVEFNDYVQPNLAVNDKELDANFFQHEPYLKNFIEEHHEVKLVNAAGVHIEPMGVYSKKIQKLDELADGATVAIPNDPTNGGRSLLLLEKAGIIKLKDGVNEKATLHDIIENKKNLRFQEVEAAQVPRTLDDVDAAVINTNYAMQANLVPTKDALFMEDSTSPYVNIVAVRAGDENRPEIQALIAALHSQEIKDFINEKYKGAVVPAF